MAAVSEVLSGRRPLGHLVAWAGEDVLTYVSQLERLPTTVRSVRAGEPAAGVVEATAVLSRGARVVAAAARFETVRGRLHLRSLTLLEPAR